MTLKEVMEIVEDKLIVFEDSFSNPLVTIYGLDGNYPDDYNDVFKSEFLDREVLTMRPGNDCQRVIIEEVQHD